MSKKQAKQGRLGLLSSKHSSYWGWGNAHEAVFAAGTLCELADNLPARADGRKGYWIKGKPVTHSLNKPESPKADFDSWHETYGFLVEPDLVVAKKVKKL